MPSSAASVRICEMRADNILSGAAENSAARQHHAAKVSESTLANQGRRGAYSSHRRALAPFSHRGLTGFPLAAGTPAGSGLRPRFPSITRSSIGFGFDPRIILHLSNFYSRRRTRGARAGQQRTLPAFQPSPRSFLLLPLTLNGDA